MPKEMTWESSEIQESLFYNTRKNPVALILLWNFSDKIMSLLDELSYNPFGVIANMRTWNGIGWVLRGLWQLDYINEVVVWGADNLNTGEAFIELMRNGVGLDYKIKGFEQPLNSDFIDIPSLNQLRSLVGVTDKRGYSLKDFIYCYQLRPELKEPNRDRKDFPPLVIPDSVILPSDGISFHTKAEDIFWGYLEVLNFVARCGTIRQTRKKEGIVHIFNISVTFPVPVVEIIHPGFKMTSADIDKYFDLNFSKVENQDHLEANDYIYSDRLLRWNGDREKLSDINWPGYNQIGACIKTLRKSNESKRASVVLLGPTDLEELGDAPCFIGFTLCVKEGALLGAYTFRSHDMFRGWPLNLLAISRLHRQMAEELEVSPGSLSINSQNAQIYERDLADALDLLDKYYYNLERRREFMRFKSDPAGNFIFTFDEISREITARLVGDSGPLLEYIHKDPEVLVNFLAVSFPWLKAQHLVYLGKQMEKLWRAIEFNEPYVQG